MDPRDLQSHKAVLKRLVSTPEFKPMKKGKLPKPFKTMGGPRLHTTGLCDVSTSHSVIFIWRDGETLQDSMFLAWMFCKLQNGDISPLFEMHLHPSHKGLHGKTPCKTESNYTNRQLPGAPEFDLNPRSKPILDPRDAADRVILITRFCQICGISIGEDDGLFGSW